MSRARRHLGSKGNRVFISCSASILAFLMLALSACGSNLGGQGQGPAPTSTPPLQVQKCGTVHTLHSQIAPADQNTARQAENCFWQAFQRCQPATLTYAENGLDAGTVNTFTLKSAGGKCAISDGVQHYIAPHPPGNTTTYTCSDVKLQSDGLYVFSCGNVGTIIVPMPKS
jgi:hypothetical protein